MRDSLAGAQIRRQVRSRAQTTVPENFPVPTVRAIANASHPARGAASLLCGPVVESKLCKFHGPFICCERHDTHRCSIRWIVAGSNYLGAYA